MSDRTMFRLSDPLGNYSGDPRRLSQGVRSPVIAYQPVQETSKPSSTKFWLTVSLLVLLVSSVFFLFVLKREPGIVDESDYIPRPRGECVECIDFDKVSKVLTDSENVEKYLQEKLNNITRINIATGDSTRSLDVYKDKHGQFGTLQEKVNKLISLKEILENAVKEAAVIENRLKKTKGEYDNKIHKIEELGNKSIETVKNVAIHEKNIKEWEDTLNGVLGTLTIADKDLKEKKIHFYDRLTEINKQIERELGRAGFTEDQIETFLNRRNEEIRRIKGDKFDCEKSNKEKQEKIDELKRQNQTLAKKLFDIEYQLKSKRMDIHALKTAQRLEALLAQLYELQESSAIEAKQYFNEILQSIESKNNEYTEIVNGKGGYTNGFKKNATEALLDAIEKERDLAKTWVSEQFRTFRISREKIKDMTTFLEETNKNITTDRKELEELLASEKQVRAELALIPQQILELQKGIVKCNHVIEESKKQLEKENEEVEKVEDLQRRINKLRSQMKEEQKKFVDQEQGTTGSRDSLAQKEFTLEESIKKARREIDNAEYNVRYYSREINELLGKEPANEDVKREEERYQKKMDIIVDTNGKIEALIKEIKKLL